MRVFSYEHVDDYRAFFPLTALFEGPSWDNGMAEELAALQRELEALFRTAGWEGDGTIMVGFLPPFCCQGEPNGTHCSHYFHVKQSNNGTSFVAVPEGLRLGWADERAEEESLTYAAWVYSAPRMR